MSRFSKELMKELLPITKQICQGFCELPIRNGTYKLSNNNIPIFIKYIIACFLQQKDHFVATENAVKWYELLDSKQTIIRLFAQDNIDHYCPRIFCHNVINYESELSKFKHLNYAKEL